MLSAALLLALVLAVTLIAARRPRLFRVLPSLFFVYALPAVASSLGVIPRASPLYGAIVEHLLPASLTLLFLEARLPAIARLGPLALATMAAAIVGILAGALSVAILLGPLLPAQGWSGIGALTASWIGGSINMVAVKVSLGTPEPVFTQAVVVDVTAAYSWMALLMALPGQQQRFDRWSRASAASLERLAILSASPEAGARLSARSLALALVLAACGSAAASLGGAALPEVPGVVARLTWTILAATAIGLALALTPARRLAAEGGGRLGALLLQLVLAAIGAQADLAAVTRAPAFLLVGVLWLLLHGAILALAARVLHAPLALVATTSQACVGGPVSAPAVAAAYRPGLAGVGLLLAVLGNALGTPLGILCGILCRRLAPGP